MRPVRGGATVPAAPAEKLSQGAPAHGCLPDSPGEGQEELQQPGRQSAGACGHAAPAGPFSPGGGAPLRQGLPARAPHRQRLHTSNGISTIQFVNDSFQIHHHSGIERAYEHDIILNVSFCAHF